MKNIFKDIKSVVFDLDDTLFLTQQYYAEEILHCAEYVIREIGDTVHTSQDILKYVVENHRRVEKPELLNILIERTVEDIYGAEIKNKNGVFEYIDKRIENFYLNVPKLVPNALEVLNYVNSKRVSIGIYSHAQQDWTERKVKYIKEEYFKEYGEEIYIQTYSTDIDGKKNTEEWGKALDHFGFIPEYTLVIGDNMMSDIIPAKEIGAKAVILVTSMYSENGILEDSNGVTKVRSLVEIINL